MNHNDLYQLFLQNFPHDVNEEQDQFFDHLSQFIFSSSHNCFVLKGYAGTGKTTLMRSVVNTYKQLKGKIVLLAATGRAAKVLSQRAGHFASTMHRYLYVPKSSGGLTYFTLKPNNQKHTLFVVDEASMISDSHGDTGFSRQSLLEDMIDFTTNGHKCKVLFIGDDAQLPPVGVELSPALDQSKLMMSYQLNVATVTLTQVIRQAETSSVLANATMIRKFIQREEALKPAFSLHKDVVRLTDPYYMEEVFQLCFSDVASENGIMIVRSNKRANKYNFDIRARIQYKEDLINSSDRLMVVKNNYFWLGGNNDTGFIANGDTIEVLSLRNEERLHGFHFIDATVQLLDYPNADPIDVKILLDVLQADGPALPQTDFDRLMDSVSEDYQDIENQKIRLEKVKKDPYLNALQVKFAHVITCHKAQGGQWPHVIIEQPWLPDGIVDREYLRWLYTAFTRAEEKVYLIGFDDTYFDE